MPDQAVDKQEQGKPATTSTTQPDKSKGSATEDQTKTEKKKKGFFAKWRDSTADAYDKHRASGGTL